MEMQTQYLGKGEIIVGEEKGKSFTVPEGKTIKVGSGQESADVTVKGQYVSREHCSIGFDPGTNSYIVTDLSTNGTYADLNKLDKGVPVSVPIGTTIILADPDNQILLGTPETIQKPMVAKSVADAVSSFGQKVGEYASKKMDQLQSRQGNEGSQQPEVYADGKPRFLTWQFALLASILGLMIICAFLPVAKGHSLLDIATGRVHIGGFSFSVKSDDAPIIYIGYLVIIATLVMLIIAYLRKMSRGPVMGFLIAVDVIAAFFAGAYLAQKHPDAGAFILLICAIALLVSLIIIKVGTKKTKQNES